MSAKRRTQSGDSHRTFFLCPIYSPVADIPDNSYVFHEVRVPLNTALLAVQNMEAEGMVPRTQEIEFKALTGSLSMMSKVLNDVLDL